MAAIDKAITQAQEALNKAVEELQSKSAELEGKAKTELDKILKPLRIKLDDLIAQANDKGKTTLPQKKNKKKTKNKKGLDVSECQKYVDDFTNTPDNLVHNLLDCFNQQLTQAQGYVNNALDNAKKLEQDLATIDGEIDKCGEKKKWKEAECYAKLVKKIAEDTSKAPQHIVEDVGKMVVLIGNLVPNLEACFMLQVTNGGKDAAKDVVDFALCAALPFP